MKQQEVQIAQQDQALKAQRLQMDAIAAADKQELEEKRLEFDIQLAGVKLGSEIKNKEKKMQMDALSAADKQELGEAKAHLDAQVKGVQLGHQISSAHKAGMNPKIPGKA
jgi:predicted TIM-barrel fold metal-dependent hydrolase